MSIQESERSPKLCGKVDLFHYFLPFGFRVRGDKSSRLFENREQWIRLIELFAACTIRYQLSYGELLVLVARLKNPECARHDQGALAPRTTVRVYCTYGILCSCPIDLAGICMMSRSHEDSTKSRYKLLYKYSTRARRA